MNKQKQYQAYLIRFQRHADRQQWRTILTNAQTNEVHHFVNENEALRFILNQLSSPPIQPSQLPIIEKQEEAE